MKLERALSLFSITFIGLGLMTALPQLASATEIATYTYDGVATVFTGGSGGGFDDIAIPVLFAYDVPATGFTPFGQQLEYMDFTASVAGSADPTSGVEPLEDVDYSFYTTIAGADADVTSTAIFTALETTIVAGPPANPELAITSNSVGVFDDLPPTDLAFTAPPVAGVLSTPLAASTQFTNVISGGGGAEVNVAGTPPYYVDFSGDAGGSFSANFTPTTPEPSPALTLGIAAAGILGLLMFRRKQSSVLS